MASEEIRRAVLDRSLAFVTHEYLRCFDMSEFEPDWHRLETMFEFMLSTTNFYTCLSKWMNLFLIPSLLFGENNQERSATSHCHLALPQFSATDNSNITNHRKS